MRERVFTLRQGKTGGGIQLKKSRDRSIPRRYYYWLVDKKNLKNHLILSRHYNYIVFDILF